MLYGNKITYWDELRTSLFYRQNEKWKRFFSFTYGVTCWLTYSVDLHVNLHGRRELLPLKEVSISLKSVKIACIFKLLPIFITVVTVTSITKTKNIKFYNRTSELAELQQIQNLSFSDHSRLTVVTGRRIGKTSLILKPLEGLPTV